MAQQLNIPESFARLSVPIPPDLERVLGYEGDQRFVAFYWTPCGDEFRQNDGANDLDGRWYAWQAYSHHGHVWAALYGLNPDDWFERGQQFDYGSSEEHARHMFVLDREQRIAYAALAGEARRFLREQIVPPTAEASMLVLTQQDLDEMARRILAGLRKWKTPAPDEIHERFEREHAAILAMETWLNNEVQP